MDLGTRIAAWRKVKGLSQIELAAAVGVTKQAVSLWEKNESGIVNSTLERVAKAFGVSMERFWGRVPRSRAA
jgi:HTH-type transcriptional regulator/antitoxin HipB